MLDANFKKQTSRIDQYLQDYVGSLKKDLPARAGELSQSLSYSLFSGGKRFRPTLSLIAADAIEVASDRVLPFAAAVEMVHTYSLIHDDLPSMDNDDQRRGQPTNHMIHGEAMALLAGDALITESFRLIARSYRDLPQVAVELIDLLSTSSGFSGMIAGQVMDLEVQGRLKNKTSLGPLGADELKLLHNLKTGQLIRAAVVGPGIVGRVSSDVREKLSDFGLLLGLCFQLADDIHDHQKSHPEPSGFPRLVGLEGTRRLLEESTERAIQMTMKLGPKAGPLRDLVVYNARRNS